MTWRHLVLVLVWAAGIAVMTILSKARPPHYELYQGIVLGILMTDAAIVVFCDCRQAVVEMLERIRSLRP